MRILSILFVLFPLFACSYLGHAQQDDVTIQFLDADDKKILTGVTISQRNNDVIGISDEYGFAVVTGQVFNEQSYVYITFKGYKRDSINTANPPRVVYLQPLSVSLDEAVVSSEKVKIVLQSAREYVVDYVFAENNSILVASFSGANGRHPKLFLLNEHGDTVVYRRLDKEPLSLFKSCVNTYYMAGTDGLYPVSITDSALVLQRPYKKSVLPRLEECKAAVGDNLYYKFLDPVNFSANFERTCIGDTVFYPFGKTGDSLAAALSLSDTKFMEYLVRTGQYGYARYVEKMRDYYDGTARKMVNTAILHPVSDSLVIFDTRGYHILVFDTLGTILYTTPLEKTKVSVFACLHTKIINDPVTNKCYAHNFKDKEQYLQEIDIVQGRLGQRIKIERPFAENVKLHNGTIYYLWQNSTGGTRQLFRQLM